ncbi:MAG: hypothetical protein E6J90_52110 [Deltaproteobacteria bacterium]|nr:MAG: hypothetical protein E6J90_52110 [Deltaproteobacteria bacterium]TMQ12706.1 MAG: hypothetical protein E6J91_20395 [Deltaproteobacteria bacterium]
MYLRVLAILLAIVMAAGATVPTASAASDVAALIDDGAPDPDLAVAVVPVVLVVPARCELGQIVAPRVDPCGRLHQVVVFRPPRQIASR